MSVSRILSVALSQSVAVGGRAHQGWKICKNVWARALRGCKAWAFIGRLCLIIPGGCHLELSSAQGAYGILGIHKTAFMNFYNDGVLLVDLFKLVLVGSALRAYPIVGEFFESCTGIDPEIRIPFLRIVHISAYRAFPSVHGLRLMPPPPSDNGDCWVTSSYGPCPYNSMERPPGMSGTNCNSFAWPMQVWRGG